MRLERYRCALIPALMLSAVCATSPASAQGVANGLRKGFPALDGQFKVIDRVDDDYNCIAHTLGLHDRWIDPETGPANAPLAPMDQIYGAFGYQRTNALDLKNDPQLQRVAVYGRLAPNGAIKEVTHAALQEPDGSWTSKLGQLPLIRHVDPYAVDGPTYGVPVATYVRPVRNQGMARGRNPQAVNAPGVLADDGGAINANGMAGVIGGDGGGPQGIGQQAPAANNGLQGNPRAGFGHGLHALRHKGHGNSDSAGNQGSLGGGMRQAGLRALNNGPMFGGGFGMSSSSNNGASSFAFAGGFANGSGAMAWASAGSSGSWAGSSSGNGQFCQGTRNTGDSLNSLLGNSRSSNNSNFQKGIDGTPGNMISVKVRGDNDTVNINMGPGGLVGSRLRVDIKGNNDTVNINFGSAKSTANSASNSAAKNASNTAANNTGAAKNSASLNAPLAGNAKNAGNSLNSLIANNRGTIKSVANHSPGNIANSTGATVGNHLRVKVAGNNNNVTVNQGPGSLVGKKVANNTTGTANAKPSTTASTKNVGALTNLTGNTGNLVGKTTLAKNTTKTPTQSTLAKNTPGNLIGAKASAKNAFAVDPKLLTGTATIQHATANKNTSGGIAKNATAANVSHAVAKNQGSSLAVSQKSAASAQNAARSRTNVSMPNLVQRSQVTNMLHLAANQNRAPVTHVAAAPRSNTGNMSVRRR